MGTADDVVADEKKLPDAVPLGGVVDKTADPTYALEEKEEIEEAEPHLSPPQVTSNSKGDDNKEEDQDGSGNDLEASRTTGSTGPPYSIFSTRKKQFIIVMTSCAGFFSPLSASIYFPALNALSSDLHVSSSLINLTLTSYMIFQGLAPTLMGDLADTFGRRPAYIIGFAIYIGACVGIALQDNFAALFVLRCLQSTGSSGTIALGSGVVADVSTSAERGTYMGWATSGMLIGPSIGPVIGGILSQFLGWRSIFWFLVILVVAFLVPFLIAFPETGRNVVGNGSVPPQGWNMSLLNYLAIRKVTEEKCANELQRTESRRSIQSKKEELAKQRKFKFPNPIKTLKVCMEKDMGLLLLYNSIVYTAFYDVNASLPYLFAKIYGFNDLQIGLSYIPFGVGGFLAPIINGKLLDRRFKQVAEANGIPIDKKRVMAMQNFPLEKARVPIALALVLVGDAALLIYGWVLEAEVNLAVPLILMFIMGFALTGSFNVMNVMLVDNYPMKPATATAANNLVRCTMGAGGTAVIIYMIDAMGRGWCFTFIAGVVLLFTPILWILLKWGPQWRMERHERRERTGAHY